MSGFAGHAGLRLEETGWPSDLADGTGAWAGEDLEAGPPAGCTRVHVWVHAAEPAGHEFHAGAGRFAAVVDALERARGLKVAVSTALTRSSARVLVGLPAWLRGRGVAAWRIVVPRVIGTPVRAPGGLAIAGVGALDGVVPRLSVAAPLALQALVAARRLGISVAIAGAPLCLLGPFAGVAHAGAPRAYAPVCAGCPARAGCPGVDAAYLERFAGDELSPRGLRAPEGAAAPAGLFAGTGALIVEGAIGPVREDMSSGTGALVVEGAIVPVREDMSSGAGAIGQVSGDRSSGTGRSGQVRLNVLGRGDE